MAKHIIGLTGLTSANKGNGIRPTFLHFSLLSMHYKWLIQPYTINYSPFDVRNTLAKILLLPLGT